MKMFLAGAVVLAGAVACQERPVQRAEIVAPDQQPAVFAPKPLPPDGWYPGMPLPPAGQQPPQSPTVPQAFVQAYVAHRSPRMMIWVNRTIQGDPLPKDKLDDLAKTAVPYDTIGASAADYSMIEASVVKYFAESGKVTIQDADAARARLDRSQVLRVENGDPAAAKLLAVELQQDVLIRITATPTNHASAGPAVRLVAKAVSTSDANILATAFVDMPLPMSKTNINMFTMHLTDSLMRDMIQKWMDGTAVEIRIYKTASVDDALRIKKWLAATKGVQGVNTIAATGGEKASYAAFSVVYAGSPEDLYADLKDAIGSSQGMKAIDVQNATIDLEVTGRLDLVTTTRRSDTITTTTTTNTEEKKIEPVLPAPPGDVPVIPPATPPAPLVPPAPVVPGGQ